MNNLKINLHPNDEKIHFNEKDHSYKIDGKNIQFSVSQIIDDFSQNLIPNIGLELKQKKD